MIAEKDKDTIMLECVSGDCEELIRYVFYLRHGGYCTKHPEKWPKIRKEDYLGRIQYKKSKKTWANPFG